MWDNITYGTGCFAYNQGACECYTLTTDEWLFKSHIFLLCLIVTLFWHFRLKNRNSVWKVVLPSYSWHHWAWGTDSLLLCTFYFSGNQTRDTTDQMMSCRIELTFAASVAAFMCFVCIYFAQLLNSIWAVHS